MSNTIKLKRGSGSDPGTSDLAVGEVALRTDTAKLFTKNDAGNVAQIGASAFTSADQVIGLYDSSGNQRVVVSGTDVTIQGTSAAVSKLAFRDRTTAYFLKFKPVDTLAADVEFTLPSADGSANHVLKTDGSGVMSFGTVATASIADNAVTLGKLFQHNYDGFIATNNNGDCTVPSFPQHSGDTFIVHDLQLNRDSSNNDPVISPGSQATITFRTSTTVSGAFGSILDNTGLQLCRNTQYVKLVAPADQSGQTSYTLTFPTTAGSANQFLQTNGSGTTSWASVSNASVASDAAIARTKLANVDVVDDTSPQLGGDLDVQSSKITTATSNGNVKIEPNGTGVVEIRGAGGNDGALQLNCSAQSHGIKLVSPAHSASQSYTIIFPDNQIAADKYLKVKSISGSGSTAIGQLEFEALDANDLGEGTIPDARFPSTLPALNGSALTNLDASNIASGTISSSRVPTLNQNTTGSAATLTTARTIGGTSFDGSANIDISYANLTNKLSVGDGGLTQNNFTNTLKSKLDGIESGATADQSNAEIAAALSDQRPSMKGATFTHDGTGSPIVNIKSDDAGPWGIRVGNDSYSTSTSHGLMAYQNNAGNVYVRLAGYSAYENLYLEQSDGSTTNTTVHLDTNRAVHLNYQNSNRLSTTSSGVSVSGTCTATTFSGSGASLTSIPAGNLTGTLPAISGANLTNLPGGGKILQIVRGSLDGSFGTGSGSFQATGCSVSITMTDSSNKVFVLAGGTVNNTSNDEGGKTTIYRGSTNIATHGDNIAGYWQDGGSNNVEQSQFLSALDTPGSGTHTYEVYIKAHGGTMYWGYRNTGVIYVLEVDA